MNESKESLSTAETESDLIDQLQLPDLKIEQWTKIVRALFPQERKREMVNNAEKDSRGRAVRYFRWMSLKDLREFLVKGQSTALDNPDVARVFSDKKDEIKQSLVSFLKKEHLEHILEQSDLMENFSLENYVSFVQKQLPRIELFRLHISSLGGGMFKGITGLTSLSVGAPMLLPSGDFYPQGKSVEERRVVIELVIPGEEVYVHPLFKTMNLEMEKEVLTRQLRKEWITDVYLDENDMISRFFQNPDYPVYEFYQKTDNYDKAFRALQEWKQNESIANLIPVSKQPDIDENNPKLKEPLFVFQPDSV